MNVGGDDSWELRFRATGLLVLAGFAAIWTVTGAPYLVSADRAPVQVAGLLLSCVIAIPSVLLLRATQRVPHQNSAENLATERRFYILTGIEVAALITAYLVLLGLQAARFIAPVSEVIVGLHFLVLALLLRVRLYSATGVGLLVFGILGSVGLAAHLSLAGAVNHWVALACTGSALTLWCTALFSLGTVARMLRRPRVQSAVTR